MSERGSGLIYVVDMESSLSEALIRRVQSMSQYVIFRKWNMDIDADAEVKAYSKVLKGIILSGSGKSINSKKVTPPSVPVQFFRMGVPVLAICYGMQYLAHCQDVPIVRCWDEPLISKRTKATAKKDKGEQGPTLFRRSEADSVLFRGLGPEFGVWMKHNWMLQSLPPGWTLLGSTDKCPVAAMQMNHFYALQFHPEPMSSLFGRIILNNFLTSVCGLETPFF